MSLLLFPARSMTFVVLHTENWRVFCTSLQGKGSISVVTTQGCRLKQKYPQNTKCENKPKTTEEHNVLSVLNGSHEKL